MNHKVYKLFKGLFDNKMAGTKYDGPLPWIDNAAYLGAQAEYVMRVLNRLKDIGLREGDIEFDKIKTVGDLQKIVGRDYRQRDVLVHTSGAFVLPHVGHSDLFNQAKKLGNILVVSSDSNDNLERSGRCTKFKSDYERAAWIAHVGSVDYVTFFIGPDASELVYFLEPDRFVKSDEYGSPLEGKKEVIEEPMVTRCGGVVRFVPRRYDISSTDLATRVIENDRRSSKNGGHNEQ